MTEEAKQKMDEMVEGIDDYSCAVYFDEGFTSGYQVAKDEDKESMRRLANRNYDQSEKIKKLEAENAELRIENQALKSRIEKLKEALGGLISHSHEYGLLEENIGLMLEVEKASAVLKQDECE